LLGVAGQPHPITPAGSLLYLSDETEENAKKYRGNTVETLRLAYIQHILTRRQQKPDFTNFSPAEGSEHSSMRRR
jgi:hypothetical protein